MTVSLKGFFIRIPCAVPRDLIVASNAVLTPQEAIGLLRGAKDRLLKQLTGSAGRSLIHHTPKDRVSKCLASVAGYSASECLSRSFFVRQAHDEPDQRAGQISTIIDQKIAEISKLLQSQGGNIPQLVPVVMEVGTVATGCAPRKKAPAPDCTSKSIVIEDGLKRTAEASRCTSPSSRLSDWLSSQFIMAMQKLSLQSENLILVEHVGIKIPSHLAKSEVQPLLERMQDVFVKNDPMATHAKEAVKRCFFSVIGETIPEAVFKGIQALPGVPGASEAMKRLGMPIPSSITRQNVGQFLHEIDNWCDEEVEPALRLEKIVKPYIDSLFEKFI